MSSARAEEIKKYGIFVVTGTYMTAKCSLTAWTRPGKEVVLGFDAGVSGLAKLGPGVEWYDTGSAGGWNRHESLVRLEIFLLALFSPTSSFSASLQVTRYFTNKSTHAEQNEDLLVVFCSGILFKPKKILNLVS
jgi:hypothetical protein